MTDYGQRAVIPARDTRPTSQLWIPAAGEPVEGVRPLSLRARRPRAGDLYVVIDDLTTGWAKVVVVPWPRVDAAGRLVFGFGRGASTTSKAWRELGSLLHQPVNARGPAPDHYELFVPPDELGEAVERGRERYGQVSRDLRIGDAFRARRVRSNDIGDWEDVLDVTAQAREAAKAALLGAVAPKLGPGDATEQMLQVDQFKPPPPPGGQVAGPVV
jgi:hypothetical protein